MRGQIFFNPIDRLGNYWSAWQEMDAPGCGGQFS